MERFVNDLALSPATSASIKGMLVEDVTVTGYSKAAFEIKYDTQDVRLENVVGAFIWVFGVTMAGYVLSDAIGDSIDTYLLPIIAVIILVSLIPPFLEWRKSKKHPAGAVSTAEAEAEAAELHDILDDE